MTLYPDKPWCEGAENVLKRVRQLQDIQWTPIRPLPNSFKFVGPDGMYPFSGHFSQWLPQHGLPYSSCRSVEKYLAWNVSIETFLSALQNPKSVVYTRSLKNDPGNIPGFGCNCYYGIVCSMYVAYALQLPYRLICAFWTDMPTIHPVDTDDTLDGLRLCDIVLNPKRHIAIITGIRRDVYGKVHSVEVSESVMPISVRNWFTPEEFRNYFLEDGFNVHRYDLVEQVTYEPSPYVHLEGDPYLPVPEINRALMLDFGNKANYRVGDEPVVIDVYEEGWEAIEVTKPDGSTERYAYTDNELILNPTEPGYYSARLVKGEEKSADIQWCMVDLKISFGKEKYAAGEPVTIRFENAADDKVFHYILNSSKNYPKDYKNFTEEESAKGEAVVNGCNIPDTYTALCLARNKYGVYTSPYTKIVLE